VSPSVRKRKQAPAAKGKRGPTPDVDAYLAELPEETRAALEKVRRMVRALVPDATEAISYRVPIIRYRGGLVGFGASGGRCSFYVMSTAVMEEHAAELAGYDTGKGTVHFRADQPLPEALVRKLVEARMRENEARGTR